MWQLISFNLEQKFFQGLAYIHCPCSSHWYLLIIKPRAIIKLLYLMVLLLWSFPRISLQVQGSLCPKDFSTFSLDWREAEELQPLEALLSFLVILSSRKQSNYCLFMTRAKEECCLDSSMLFHFFLLVNSSLLWGYTMFFSSILLPNHILSFFGHIFSFFC